MKYNPTVLLCFILTLITSCSSDPELKEKHKIEKSSQPEQKEAFKDLFENSEVKGSVLIYDLNNDIYYSNDFDWANQGQLPASTFKIPNSIIGLETGVITDTVIFKWDGEQKWNENWMQDLNLNDALKFSCVPCYQKLARDIGEERMIQKLDELEYPKMVIDSNTIDLFWLEGESKISQFQQIDFLVRFYQNKLPISEETSKTLRKILVLDELDDLTLSGKTGLSITDSIYNGWFVGYIEKGDDRYFFATNIEKKIKEETEFKPFFELRKSLTQTAFDELGITY